MVFQQFNLFPHLTVIENLMLGPVRARKLPREEARQLAQVSDLPTRRFSQTYQI